MFDTDDAPADFGTSWVREPPKWIDDYAHSTGAVFLHQSVLEAGDTAEDTNAARGMLFAGGVGSAEADAVLEQILDCEQRLAAVQAQQIRALARFAQLRPDPDGTGRLVDSFAADEVAPLLRISRHTALTQLHLAIELTTRLADTLTALGRGDIDLRKARIIQEATRVLSAEHAAAVQARVLPQAADQTPGQLQAALRHAVLRVDPDGAEQRRQQRVRDRAVVLDPRPDGVADLIASNLDAADAVAAYQHLDAYARAQGSGDQRSMDQRRADALVDLVLGRGTAETTTQTQVQVQVTVAASTLIGLDDLPGELAGYGPITAQQARELATDGTWRRILTDPVSGARLDVGRTTYRPPAAMADFVRTRDRTCRFPGCRQPAQRCDIDHGLAYPNGPTAVCNLCCMCRHHHRGKHERDWTIQHGTNATITWTSPTGRTYTTTTPEPLTEPTTNETTIPNTKCHARPTKSGHDSLATRAATGLRLGCAAQLVSTFVE